MRRDRHRGQRLAVIVVREQPDRLGLRVIVIPEFRGLDLYVRHLEPIEQMPGQFTARPRVVLTMTAMSVEDPFGPQLRPDQHDHDQE